MSLTTSPAPRRVFLDIGGHLGQTLEEVLDARYRFDVVHCFEPHPGCVATLHERFAAALAEERLVIHPFGLADSSGSATLFGAEGSGGASLFDRQQDVGRVTIALEEATSVFDRLLREDDLVIAKMNCEGAEGAILQNLAASGRIDHIDAAMIDFDLFKIAGQRREPFAIMKQLRDAGFDRYDLCKEVMIGPTHQRRIRNWLATLDEGWGLFASDRPTPQRATRVQTTFRLAKFQALALLESVTMRSAASSRAA